MSIFITLRLQGLLSTLIAPTLAYHFLFNCRNMNLSCFGRARVSTVLNGASFWDGFSTKFLASKFGYRAKLANKLEKNNRNIYKSANLVHNTSLSCYY